MTTANLAGNHNFFNYISESDSDTGTRVTSRRPGPVFIQNCYSAIAPVNHWVQNRGHFPEYDTWNIRRTPPSLLLLLHHDRTRKNKVNGPGNGRLWTETVTLICRVTHRDIKKCLGNNRKSRRCRIDEIRMCIVAWRWKFGSYLDRIDDSLRS